MPRMTAADAAVAILRREGVTNVFGLPGAAIDPFYAAMRRDGGITHTLARHVEGASHMAEGYTRARAGNIGVCVGTSGPAGTDMLTGLYSAAADSIPILCITGQAPVAKLHKADFPAVDIPAIAAPLTKIAMTVLQPAEVPGAFQQRSTDALGRQGPVLIELPFDVQLAAIDFDIDTYQPLPVYKPAATRAQIAKALDMLPPRSARSSWPAAASSTPTRRPAGRIRRADRHAGGSDADGLGRAARRPPAHGRMAGLQTSHRYSNATLLASASCSASATGGQTGTPAGWPPTPRAGRSCTSTSSRPRSGGSSRRTAGSSPTPRAALRLFVRWPGQAGGVQQFPWVDSAALTATSRGDTHYGNWPFKPLRVNEARTGRSRRRRGTSARSARSTSPGVVTARLPAAALDQRGPGGPARARTARPRSASASRTRPTHLVGACRATIDFHSYRPELALARFRPPGIHVLDRRTRPRPDPKSQRGPATWTTGGALSCRQRHTRPRSAVRLAPLQVAGALGLPRRCGCRCCSTDRVPRVPGVAGSDGRARPPGGGGESAGSGTTNILDGDRAGQLTFPGTWWSGV